MRVLLVPSFNFVGGLFEPYVPYGVMSLQAASSAIKGVTVDVCQFTDHLLAHRFQSSNDLAEYVFTSNNVETYDVVGLSIVCNALHHAVTLANFIRAKCKNMTIIAGGPFVTKLASRFLAAFEAFDGVFVGEAETSFVEFLRRNNDRTSIDYQIPGLTTRRWLSGPSEIIEDLDNLPVLWQFPEYLERLALTRRQFSDSAAPVEAARGCPLKCSFCSTRQVWGARVRRKSVHRLVEEMWYIESRTGDTFFSLVGDNLGVPREPFLRFCDDMARNRGEFTWSCSLKLDRMTREDIDRIWAGGCRGMFIGVESASQQTLANVRKAAVLAREIDNIYLSIDRGFMVETSFIIGFPWETRRDVEATYGLHCDLLEAGAYRSQVGALCPIPGTDIVAGEEIRFDRWRSYISGEDVPTGKELDEYIERFPDLFAHLGHYPTHHITRAEVWAYRDAAMRMAALYRRGTRAGHGGGGSER